MTDTNLIKHRRTLGRLAPRATAAVLLRQASGMMFEAARILSAAPDGVPETDDVNGLMLAIDDVVARLDGDLDARTFFVVKRPDEVDDV